MFNDRKVTLPLTARSGGVAFTAMILIYMVLTVIVQPILFAFSVTEGVAFTAVNALIAPLSILIVLIISSVYSHRKISYSLGVSGCRAVFFGIAVLIAFGMFFGLGFVNGLVSKWLESLGVSAPSISLDLTSVGNTVLFSVLLALIPAVMEEVFFRGLMLKSLDGAKVWQSVLFVSVCFALYHCSASQLAYQLIYGAALCLLALAAKSVLPCVLAHFLNNFTVIILTHLGVSIDFYNPLIIVGGLLSLALGVWLTVLYLNKAKKDEKETL